jgi:aspartyl-tRNA(Asn)/glutamyl-tRNA(Gln) amidotransferase subunit C
LPDAAGHCQVVLRDETPRDIERAAKKGIASMSVDQKTVKRVAHLARIAVTEEEVTHLQGELNAILAFVAQLDELDVSGVEPMTSVIPMKLKMRADVVIAGGEAAAITSNAPVAEDHFFMVPKVVE